MRRAVSAVALLVAGCRDPTEVTVQLVTDEPCDRVVSTTITAAAPDELAARSVVGAATTACAEGSIGSIVIIPGDADDLSFGIRVVAGIGVDAENECTVENGFAPAADPAAPKPPYKTGCIVARRSLSFIPHTPLVLPIALRDSCIGVPCEPTETCVSGSCVGATVDPSLCADPAGCGETDLSGSGAAGAGGPGGPGSGGFGGAGGHGAGGGGTGGHGGVGAGGAAGGCSVPLDGECCTNKDCATSICVEIVQGGYRVCAEPPARATDCTSGMPPDLCCNSSDCQSGYACWNAPKPPAFCIGGSTMPIFNECATDECKDVNCAPSEFCVPAGALGYKVRACLPAACHVASECTDEPDGACVPVTNDCCGAVVGLYCAYPSDGCRSTADCASGKHCAVDGSRIRCVAGKEPCPQ